MDDADRRTFRSITRWTILSYVTAITITLMLGLEQVAAMAG